MAVQIFLCLASSVEHVVALRLVCSFRASYIYFALMDFPDPGNKQHRQVYSGALGGREAGSQTGITSDYTRWPGGGDVSVLLALRLNRK